ncbi:uncharacterized protein TRUGW13939_06483 [Talaromyces rugulosus]|uniref:Uncharacterized protein n=1 Tax=Talaromyces rugulosus TaxID=121627 RepID=A0A7H8QZ24_TALRU|nr:uncharacterized protein TRUGW13939_06483 [Talaromyces rugulosus]QKX59349.1 hypothetical protein TRUGW13939_06483 [Talaromyces rugulosus]
MGGSNKLSSADLLSHCIEKRLRVSSKTSERHTFDLFTLSPNDSFPLSYQAEQLRISLISILKAHSSEDISSRIILVSGNLDSPPVLSPLTAAIQQLILRKPPPDQNTEKQPMIWALCSRYFRNSIHEGPDAVVKGLVIQLHRRGFFPVKGFDYKMDCGEFEFGLALLKSILSPEQEKLSTYELWIMLDHPSFFFEAEGQQSAEWTGKMESLIRLLAKAVKENLAIRLVVTDPGKMDEVVHGALSPCTRLSWETGRGKGNGWFDIEEP